jgi:hypothetical protein
MCKSELMHRSNTAPLFDYLVGAGTSSATGVARDCASIRIDAQIRHLWWPFFQIPMK